MCLEKKLVYDGSEPSKVVNVSNMFLELVSLMMVEFRLMKKSFQFASMIFNIIK
jgi:hypothetical protein